MATITVQYDSDLDAQRLIRVLKRNRKHDREQYGIKIIRKEESPTAITTPTGEKIKLKSKEIKSYNKLSSSVKRQKAITEHLFFKAQGTFRGSKPQPNSPYQTSGPFFSNSVLGQVIWPGHQQLQAIHSELSRSLNDRHIKTGEIGDWRQTHSTKFGGYWSFRAEKFIRINLPGNKSRNIIVYSDFEEAST